MKSLKYYVLGALVLAALAGCGSGSRIVNLTEDGAWCWFADPRAVYYEGQHKRTYVGWVNKAGDVQAAYYDHQTRTVTSATLRAKLQYDDHANPAILIRPNGRLMVFYSRHGDKEAMFYRISNSPESIASWGREMQIKTNIEGKYGYTYPNPVQLSAEDNLIYLFWRGGDFKPNFSTSKDGINFSPARTLIKGSGDRPYIKFESNGTDKIHFAFTDGHPRKEPTNNIYYAYYYNGAIYKADGTKIRDMAGLPIEPAEADKVYDAVAGSARAWIWDIALDSSGHPVIVYATFPKETEHHYRYARWSGSKWEDFEIVAAGRWFPQTQEGRKEREPFYSGGVVLDHSDPSIVYLSRQINGVFEIEKWVTSDGGANWNSEAITSGSKKNNVRPVVPRNHKPTGIELIWMHGDYVFYTKYDTALKLLLPSLRPKGSHSNNKTDKNTH